MSDETKVTRDSDLPTLFARPAKGVEFIEIDGVRIYQGQTGHFKRSDGQWVFVEWLTPPAPEDDDDGE